MLSTVFNGKLLFLEPFMYVNALHHTKETQQDTQQETQHKTQQNNQQDERIYSLESVYNDFFPGILVCTLQRRPVFCGVKLYMIFPALWG